MFYVQAFMRRERGNARGAGVLGNFWVVLIGTSTMIRLNFIDEYFIAYTI